MQFPASAANSLIEGYCSDFVSLAATLAQTLEQVSMRGIDFGASRPSLERTERGMRELAEAIRELIERGSVSNQFENVLGRPETDARPAQSAAPAPAPARPAAPAPHAGRAPIRQAPPTPGPAARPPAGAAPSRPHPQGPAAPRSIGASSPARTARPSAPPARAAGAPVSASAAAARAASSGTLKGNNRSMPLLSVFQFLGRMRKSGTVHVQIADETLAFEFVNGCIEFTASNKCPVGERLGELLVELGFADRDTLAPMLAKVGVSSAHRLGHLVIESRVCSNGQVLEALEAQVRRRFQRACSNPDASYEFEEGRRLPGDGRIRITPFELSFEPGRIGS